MALAHTLVLFLGLGGVSESKVLIEDENLLRVFRKLDQLEVFVECEILNFCHILHLQNSH